MAYTVSKGAKIHWRSFGSQDKPAIVLLHGIGTDHMLFARIVPLLIYDYRLIGVDARGHGASDTTPGDCTLEQLADDVLAIMDDAGVERAIICGLSLGGMMAQALVLKAPERVDGLVLACTSSLMEKDFWARRAAMVLEKGIGSVVDMSLNRQFSEWFREQSPAWVDSSRHVMHRMTEIGYVGCGKAIDAMDYSSRLGEIAVPTTVVCGDLDISTPYAGHGDRLVAGIAGAELVMLKSGHLACLENPEGFAAALRKTAERCWGRPAVSTPV